MIDSDFMKNTKFLYSTSRYSLFTRAKKKCWRNIFYVCDSEVCLQENKNEGDPSMKLNKIIHLESTKLW